MAGQLFDVIYPRAWIELVIVFDNGEQVVTGVAPSSVNVSRNPHYQADTCECEVDLSPLIFGQRTVASIFLTAFMGVVNKIDAPIKTADKTNLQFCGYVDEMNDKRSKDGVVVQLKARDLSSLLRGAKPLVTKRVAAPGLAGMVLNAVGGGALNPLLDPTPTYGDTVLRGIQRVFAWAGISDGELRIRDPMNLGSLKLSQAVSSRERSAHIPIKRDSSAWDAIEHIAALASVIVNVELGELVLRPPSDLLGQVNGVPQSTSYDFVFGLDGGNTLELERHKKLIRNRKGVKVVGFDPKTRRSFSAVYPPDGDLPPKHMPVPRHKQQPASGGPPPASKEVTTASQDRDIYTFGLEGLSSVDQAQKIAERIWIERAHQELEGSIITRNWTPDLFKLRNGNRIGLTVSQRLEHELRNFNDRMRQVQFLREQLGIDEQAAQSLLNNTSKEEQHVAYYARSIKHQWSTKTYQTHIDFVNLMTLG